eukprot:jgi/Psemu1/287501/fgenesh1_pg.194_\
MVANGLFRTKTLLPVLVAVFLTPIPRRLGFYRWFFEFIDPAFAGILPCTLPSDSEWGFTLGDLYGDRNGSSRNRLNGQTAIVTGANSGTGYEISLALARLGASVTMACRNPSRCDAAAERIRRDAMVRDRSGSGSVSYAGASSVSVSTMTVNVSSLASVRDFCDRYLSQTRDANGVPLPLDMLFLNAGIGYSPGRHDNGNDNANENENENQNQNGSSLVLSEDGIELVFATNVVGHHLMYRLLEPSLRRSDEARIAPPRIVQTSSGASFLITLPYGVATDLETLNNPPPVASWFPESELGMNLYGQSKLAQILWVRELTARLDRETRTRTHREGHHHAAGKSKNYNNYYNPNPNAVVYANAGHPGLVATNIWANNARNGLPFGRFLELAVKLLRSLVWTPEEGALTLLYLGTALEDLQANNIRGQYYHPQARRITDREFARFRDPGTKDLQERLWKFLDDLVADYVGEMSP